MSVKKCQGGRTTFATCIITVRNLTPTISEEHEDTLQLQSFNAQFTCEMKKKKEFNRFVVPR